MKERYAHLGRRRFLRGAGGVALGLPLLDAFRTRRARAAGKTYSFFFKQANGFAKAEAAYREGELFLPSRPGPLTTGSLGADADRALSELKDHAGRLVVVAGASFAHGAPCGHFRGIAQVLTAAALSEPAPYMGRSQPLPLSESLDSRIARELLPGREPLVVHAERGSSPRTVSWRGPRDPRSSQGNPFVVYQNLVGLASTAVDARVADQIRARHRAVNDLVREEIAVLQRRTDLSAEDRRRLDLHLTSIREIEVKLASKLAPETTQAVQGINGKHRQNELIPDVVKLHMDLVAWAFASDALGVAVLQTGADVTYNIDGYNLNGVVPSFHQISHRILSDGADGPALPDAQKIHHRIDRLHARYFKHFLDRLAAYTLPEGGTLLDRSLAVWCNENATGWHRTDRVPFIVAGGAGGYLKTGQYIDLGGCPHNRLLATLLNAALGRPKDRLIESFGDPALPPAVVREMLA
jgi:hypothetical protein